MTRTTAFSTAILVCFCGALACAGETAMNAALDQYGAKIELTCKAPTPLNARWNKPHDMLRASKPAGPIIEDLASARATLKFPVKYHVLRVGIIQGDYKGSFARAKECAISAPDHPEQKITLENKPGQVQLFDYKAETDRIEFAVQSIYPPDEGNVKYGSFNQIQVLVEEDLSKVFCAPAGYPRELPTYVMVTPNLDPQQAAKVIGEPRKSTGHPCTIWDAQDIDEMKAQIKSRPAAQAAYNSMLAFCEKACAQPIQVPDKPDDGVDSALGAQHSRVATSIGNLGIGYALSGTEKYAAEAKRLLLELAKRYEGWPVHGHPKFTHDKSKWGWQRLNDAIWLIPAAWGYDLIHDSTSINDEERKQIAEHFIMPCVKQIMSSPGIIASPTNWSAICCAAVMIGARATGDKEYYGKSCHGIGKKPDEKKGGVLFHIEKGIDDDGMWGEGSLGYQYMAMRGLLVMAEILWHDGVDVYGYQNSRLKLIFDSPIWYAYPGGTSSPAIHDGGGGSIFGRDAHLYQYAARRYADKTYNGILSKITPTFESIFNLFLPACDFSAVNAAELPAVPSILFPGVGFGIGRTGEGDDAKYLIMDYGPTRSHGHADKLNFCLYGLGQELFAEAGSAWYSTDIYLKYYSQTISHNTLVANAGNQIMASGRLEAYGSCGDLVLMRASCDTAIPATVFDRTLLLSGNRLYDAMLAYSSVSLTFELPYHCYGTLEQKVATEAWADHPKDEPGYCYFKNPLAAKVETDWSCDWVVGKGRVNFRVLGEPGTEAVFATAPKGASDLPIAMPRRKTNKTVFAAVADLIPNGAQATVKSVQKLAAADLAAYGLDVVLADGAREVLLVNYSAQAVTLGEWKTDARVAFVRFRDKAVEGFYLAGGRTLEGPGLRLTSSEPSLLACSIVKDGLMQLENQGKAAVKLSASGLGAFQSAALIDAQGKRVKDLPLAREGDRISLELAPRASAELFQGEQPTAADYRKGIREAKLKALLEREEQERQAQRKSMAEQQEKAKAFTVPKDYFVAMQAETPAAEGGGKVASSDKKTAIVGLAISQWNNKGHWLEYECDIAHEGYYQLALKYCREGGPTHRSVLIDGQPPFAEAREWEFAGTGGWSNGTDNWQIAALRWPLVEAPYLLYLKAGKHRIKLENLLGDDGLNLDYLVLAPAGVEIDRKAIEAAPAK